MMLCAVCGFVRVMKMLACVLCRAGTTFVDYLLCFRILDQQEIGSTVTDNSLGYRNFLRGLK